MAKNSVNILFGDLLEPGTTSHLDKISRADSTTSGPAARTSVPVKQTTAEAILEIRRRSGLTWQLLSELFNVSRRCVHHWANGKAPSAQHERDIRQALAAVRHLDEGSQRATRDRLLSTTSGQSAFDLLAARHYAVVLRQPAGAGLTIPERHHIAISDDEQARRRPPPPALLLDARQDRPEIPVSKARIVRAVRTKKRAQ